jgi:hypothetical protein
MCRWNWSCPIANYSKWRLTIGIHVKKINQNTNKQATIEQECYAIVEAVDKWNKYLRGKEFILVTDHEPLVNFSNNEQPTKRCDRWRLKLVKYRFKVKHIQNLSFQWNSSSYFQTSHFGLSKQSVNYAESTCDAQEK